MHIHVHLSAFVLCVLGWGGGGGGGCGLWNLWYQLLLIPYQTNTFPPIAGKIHGLSAALNGLINSQISGEI